MRNALTRNQRGGQPDRRIDNDMIKNRRGEGMIRTYLFESEADGIGHFFLGRNGEMVVE